MDQLNPSTVIQNNLQQEEESPLYQGLRYYAIFIRPYLWLYAVAPLLMLIGALIYVQTLTPQFRATSQLHISSGDLGLIDVRGVSDPTAPRLGDAFINTQMLLIRSKEVIDRAYGQVSADAPALPHNCSLPEVSRVPGTMLVNVSVTSSDAEMATRMANTVAEAYIETTKFRQSKISTTGTELLRNQLEELKKSREAAVEEMLQFKAEKGIYNLQESYNSLLSQINALNGVIADAQVQESELQTTMHAIEENRANAVKMMPFIAPQGVGNTTNISTFKTMELTHAMALPELLRNYNEGHSVIQTHHKVMEMIKQAGESEVDLLIEGLRLQYQRAQKRTEILNAQIKELNARLFELDRISNDYLNRENACTSLEDNYRKIVNRINEINLSEGISGPSDLSIFMMSPAVKPDRPFAPNKKKTCGVALLLGLAMAGAVSFVLASLNNSVKDTESLLRMLGPLPIFGNIPAFNAPEEEILKTSGREGIDEAFRNIRTALNLSASTRGNKFYAVSSCLPGEGKTFASFNLARSFALDNQKVLLVDTDLRRPRLHKLLQPMFPERPDQGISNILIGDCDYKQVVRRHPDLKMDLIFSGPIPPNSAELLGSPRLNQFLDAVKQDYDIIIMDTQPMLDLADTYILAAHNVPVLLTSRIYSTPLSVYRLLAQRLHTVKLSLAGLLPNLVDVPAKSLNYYYGHSRYGYRYKYGYYYHYGYGEDNPNETNTKGGRRQKKGKPDQPPDAK